MSCGRCHGLMVEDRFLDIEASGQRWFFGWRCTTCGNIEDPEIRQNRVRHHTAVSRRRHTVAKQFPIGFESR
jgi:hypothetical protein